jgi:hypothetical protein
MADQPNETKWGWAIDQALLLPMGHHFDIEGDAHYANRFRSMLRVTGRVSMWKFTVRNVAPFKWRITKTGRWPGYFGGAN